MHRSSSRGLKPKTALRIANPPGLRQTSTATFDAGTPTPTPQSSMQQQHQRQPQQQQHIYHQTQPPQTSYSAFAYHVPVISSDFGAAAAGALPSPPYVCSPQQSTADLGGYALSPPPDSSATFPLQIVNEQGFGQGRAPPVRSASNGSSWSAGSSGGGGSGAQTERTHVTSGVSDFFTYPTTPSPLCKKRKTKQKKNIIAIYPTFPPLNPHPFPPPAIFQPHHLRPPSQPQTTLTPNAASPRPKPRRPTRLPRAQGAARQRPRGAAARSERPLRPPGAVARPAQRGVREAAADHRTAHNFLVVILTRIR